jgi:DNA-binding LacI/PurR family transcriptional regulator
MAARMKDVAERVGVSVATVSHVLNNTRFVAPETRRRVLEAIRELNYYQNVHARRLARGSSDFYALIISDIENPFFPELIKSFEMQAVEHGLDVLLCPTSYNPDRIAGAVRKAIENKVRGVAVMTTQAGPEVAAELTAHQMPVVSLDLATVGPYQSSIRVDYSRGASQAVEHLWKLGHRRIGLIAGPGARRSAARYREAVVEALKQRGLEPLRIVEGNGNVDGGVAGVRVLLAEKTRPTAIFCGNDLTAIGALAALEDAGLRVPDDVSVVGSDDILFARLARPPLTTVKLPRELLGKLAFKALEKMLRSKQRRGAEYVLRTQLVVRGSTGPVRRDSQSRGS